MDNLARHVVSYGCGSVMLVAYYPGEQNCCIFPEAYGSIPAGTGKNSILILLPSQKVSKVCGKFVKVESYHGSINPKRMHFIHALMIYKP